MEKYMANMRIILCANSTSKLIAPIKSRCLLMRVAAPDTQEVSVYHVLISNTFILILIGELDGRLPHACRKEGKIPPSIRSCSRYYSRLQREFAKSSTCAWSIKNAIVRYLYTSWTSFWAHFPLNSPDLTGRLTIAKPDWETYCHKVADMIVQEQTPGRILEVRAKLYELLSHCIPATVILKVRQARVHDVRTITEARSDDRRKGSRESRWNNQTGRNALGRILCQWSRHRTSFPFAHHIITGGANAFGE